MSLFEGRTVRPTRWIGQIFGALVLVLFLVTGAGAVEEIRSFASKLVLSPTGTVDVTEFIEIQAEGDEIRRGILRDIPTVLLRPDGSLQRSNLKVISVRRDGQSEPFAVENLENGKRIRIGQADIFLDPGLYRYEIRYTMTRQARQFADMDELFWNVTGNFWNFPIRASVVTITLPAGAVILDTVGFTGRQGSEETNVAVTRMSDNQVVVRSTVPFARREGLSVSVAFEKGALVAPEFSEASVNFLSDNRGLILPGIAVFLVLLFNFFAWDSVGRDPKRGTIIPLFYPPKRFSPALTHYVHRMGWQKGGWTGFTAAIISLATRGLISIGKKGKDSTFAVTGKRAEGLPPGEAVLFDWLRTKRTVRINKSSGKALQATQREFIKTIEDENRRVYFRRNTPYVVAGVGLSVVSLGAMVAVDVLDPLWLFLALFVGVFIVIGSSAFSRVLTSGGIGNVASVFFLFIFISNFLPVLLNLTGRFSFDVAAFAAVSIVATNAVFAFLMRAPTIQGRKVMDEIEGFRMYLETAEKERLNLSREPDLTTSRFEAILPFAIALGVEKPWSEHFEAELARNTANVGKSRYSPHWYSGTNFSSGSLSSTIASTTAGLSSAMMAAQPASSSSSGFSGGSSGGGGGGGGGGGW